MGHVFVAQQQIDLIDAFPKPRHRLVRRTAEPAELVRQKGTREADIQPPAADRVEHRDLTGELQRVIERRQHRAGDEACMARPLRCRGEEHDRVGAVAAVMMEIMLDDADMAEAELVRLFGEVERFLEIGFARFLFGLHIGEELNAELHAVQDRAGRSVVKFGSSMPASVLSSCMRNGGDTGMDRTARRELQAPLKAKYRDQPGAALITLRAKGDLAEGAIACKVETGRALVEAGLHPATGGSGIEACSGDMLLEALVACAGVTLKAVATALEIRLDGGSVKAEGDLDFRGTLGVDRTAPVGFRAIRLAFELDVDEPQERIDTLLKLTERYCVVLQTLRNAPEIAASISRRA